MIKRKTIKTNYLQTLDWIDNQIVDWASAGNKYSLDGKVIQTQKYHFGFGDSSITSSDGKYAFIYQKLGTKGLLLKEGEILREINRSYYYADSYEYPVAFVTARNGITYLIHCPNEYCQIDFEEVETGKIITNSIDRKPKDFFHSRFEISPDSKTLISKGWEWHPCDLIKVYEIEECIKNPILLDESLIIPNADSEICLASFINDDLILIGSPNESEPFDEEDSECLANGQIAVWDFKANEISKPITPNFTVGGNLFPIDETLAWDLYDFPKIVNFKTGEVISKIEEIRSGKQISSIISHLEYLPKIRYNRSTKQIAIVNENRIEVLTI